MNLAFFDTNVLIYADDPSAPDKQKRANDLFTGHLEHGMAALSLQVLQEYYATVTRKLGIAPDFAQRRVEIFGSGNVVRFEVEDVVEQARSNGAEITREPSETFYGGYAGAFLDLDGHPWEVAHNPGFGLDDDGRVVLPDT